MPTIAAHTLGCKVNQYDTQAMLELFMKEGYQSVSVDHPAVEIVDDLYVYVRDYFDTAILTVTMEDGEAYTFLLSNPKPDGQNSIYQMNNRAVTLENVLKSCHRVSFQNAVV